MSLVRPTKKPVFITSSVTTIKHLSKLRLRFSPLNAHRFRYNFDCLGPLCVCGAEDEEKEHFFLHCHLFQTMSNEIFGQFSKVPGLNISNLAAKTLCKVMLYGSSKLNVLANRLEMEATLLFIKNTKRFS